MAKNSPKEKSGLKLVVVESPTKARTIKRFLGKDYVIESCMGHVRDLPQSARDIPAEFKKKKWATLGVNVDEDFEPIYTIPKNKTKVVSQLKQLLQDADELILATDEDREGESISWHLVETLKPKVPYRRMVFNEITKDAILGALKETRSIDSNLVRAQEARRILDRLVGYTISPLLWKKIAYGLSAGRVQSVAVRLICEREHERIRFRKADFWDLEAELDKAGKSFPARLHSYKNQKIAMGRDFNPESGQLYPERKGDTVHILQADAERIQQSLKGKAWKVTEAEEKPLSRKPPTPFITSTLQQESNRKLGLTARETMQVAQNLYEQGHITYMRTDSTFLSQQALDAARGQIVKQFGKEYLPDEARKYEAKKVKGAQEAHEAIRPAGTEFLHPDQTKLSGLPLKLYELIWRRTIASQMMNARLKQMSVRIKVEDAVFAASGLTIEFDGYMRAYLEEDDDAGSEDNVKLPKLAAGDSVQCKKIESVAHETKPPARYTEASIVQKMEKEGIGRPSTYASIIGTIIDRGYVRRQANALVPTFTAMVVSKLLTRYFPQFVDLGFTSEMERSLDNIAEGDLDQLKYLKDIYHGKEGLKKQIETQQDKIDPAEARSIELVGLRNLSFRVGRYGAYVCRKQDGDEVCASIPESQSPADMTAEVANKLIDQKINGSDALGKDPASGLPVYVLSGRFGPYVQLGEAAGDDNKPKRASLPAGLEPEKVDLKTALELLSLPKTLGQHPDSKKDVKAGIGRFGPYIVCDGDFRSIPKTESIFSIDLKKALEMLAKPKTGRGRAVALRDLGVAPNSEDKILVFNGKYGPYVKCGKVNVSLPEGLKPEEMTIDQALELIESKAGTVGKKAKTKSEEKGAVAAKAKTKVKSAAAGSQSKELKSQNNIAPKSKKAQTVVRRVAR